MADAQAIAQALMAALAPLVQALQPPAAAAPQPHQAVAFASTPAQACLTMLDYETPGDTRIFNNATTKLATTFSLDKPNVTVLLAKLNDRAINSAWTNTLQVNFGAIPAIPPMEAVPGIPMQVLQDYGRMSLPELRVCAENYQVVPERHAQNDFQLYVCLTNSVDEDTKAKMQREAPSYMIGVGNNIASGLLYFKKLIMKVKVDSRATASHIRDNLGALDTYMINQVASNISDFNDYVRDQVASLTARGETSQDLLNNLFKGYTITECEEFRDFVKTTRNEWETGQYDNTPDTLMNLALDKYKQWSSSNDGESSPRKSN